ncbi:MAG: hypothetical protein D6761_12300 [Candidatus Dadabacteria bacterium]|nr:MAG: hypothetical protein D6761_12300 [Candidatus Dadabacteria bacterium]
MIMTVGGDAPTIIDRGGSMNIKALLPLCLLLVTACDDAATNDRPSDTELAKLRATCSFAAGDPATVTTGYEIPVGPDIRIDHFVLIMQENRSFDHYFARLPEAGVTDVAVAPLTASNPDTDGTLRYAYHETMHCIEDVAHSWNASHLQYNDGRNDGFVTTNNPDGVRALGYYDESDLPFYYGIVKTFASADRFFCSMLGPTWPNRMFFFAGTSYGRTNNQFVPDGVTVTSIFDLLDERDISWTIYSQDLPGAAMFPHLLGKGGEHLKGYDEFFEDAAAGRLPAVALVDPEFNAGVDRTDEHPPGSHQAGQAFVASVVNAVRDSPLWPSSAVIVTYDEHGGYYDHVPPPPACPPDEHAPILDGDDVQAAFDRFGFRVPLLVVSPWARPGYIEHRTLDHTSVIRMIEARYDLPALTARDANALPLTVLFDFSGEPPLLDAAPLPEATVDEAALQLCRQMFPGDGGGIF